MTRVHGRSVLANFDTPGPAHEASRRIREKGLGTTQVSDLADFDAGTATQRADRAEILGPDAGLYSSDNLGPLSLTSYTLIEDSLDHPTALTSHRPRLGSTLLTVVAAESDVPAVVAIIKDLGGNV